MSAVESATRYVKQAQVKHLEERLRAATYKLTDIARSNVKYPEPANVKAARKVVAKFDAAKRKARDAAGNRISARSRDIKTAILFGTPEHALTMLEAFERRGAK